MAAPQLPTTNEALLDATIRHQVFLARFSGSVRNKILKLLDDSEAEIASRVESRLRNAKGGLGSPEEVRRLETLLASIRRVRFAAWAKATERWVEELTALALGEPKLIASIIQTVAPVVLEMTLPAARVLRSIVTSRPFQGRVLREWAKSASADDVRRISDAVRTGMVAGDGAPQIVRRVIGSRALKGRDGVTQITRNGIEAITRTAVNHISNAARQELFRDNADVISEELYVATLDARTTPICRSLDGKRFPTGTGPQPPIHFACRSTRVAVIDGEVYGNRPAKSFSERQLLREFAEREGIDPVSSRDALPRGSKGKFDAFARKRGRELIGSVPAKTTYAEWLRSQPASLQDDILGKTRGRLFRSGELSLDRFVNRAGDEIPLADLAKRHADAFRAAGLEPSGF